MIAIGSREAMIQNLKDAGCEPEMIQDFLGWFDRGQQKKQLELLEYQTKRRNAYFCGRCRCTGNGKGTQGFGESL